MEHGTQPSACVGAGVDNLSSGQRYSADDRPVNAAKLADSQLARAPRAAAQVGGGGVGVGLSVAEVAENGEVKRKRGRPPRSQGKVGAAAGPTAKKSKKDEEDVCFICFDGGKLVLCDRRDCPKAYHPACVKRDESFFRRRVRWNCGWHLCNVCQKNALFMCYTCPYSLCKGCVKQADVLSVRGNQGFCRTCMTTIMLIENVTEGNKEMAQVDFDDKSSWEYLFKVYWIYLKQKESLTVDELTQATNPWRGFGLDQKTESLPKMHNIYAAKTSLMSCTTGQLEANASKRRKTRKQPNMQNQDSQLVEKVIEPVVSCSRDNADWASKDLLEFVIHMRNGDTSMLSQFDVQALLLEYIRKNNLRDPRRKCQIICDQRLENLFGKARVGHFEMLKLLEYHFKEESRASNVIQGAADSMAGQKEAVGISEDAETMSRDKKRQTSKKSHETGQIDLDNYAAVDIHNIGLIYLKRNLMENLIQDAEKFHDKVVGSVVRIRIPGNDQKPDMYRLVRVVGTSKAAEACTAGNKTANVMLKILNLNKIEDVAIDGISNQEFTEDECGRLRQSIECGFAQRMTVGEIQEKAIALQAVRVNDSLEAEILRLNHLRDRASEMGHRKELREFVEKLELLNTPAERERRLQEIPEVHADPRLDPGHESDDDYGQSDVTKQDLNLTPNNSNSSAKAVEFIAPKRVGKLPNSSGSKAHNMTPNSDRKRKSARLQSGKEEGAIKDSERSHQYSQKPEKANAASRVLGELRDRVDPSIQESSHAAVISGSFSGAAADTSSPSVSTGLACVSGNGDFDKVWHYQDPSGRVQGPFFMLQLRKWSSNGYFPTDLRVWRINEKQDQSILLTEALTREPQFQHNDLSKFQVAEVKSDSITAESLGKLSSNHDSAVIFHTRSNEAGSIGLTSAVSGRATNGRRCCKKSGKSQRYLPAQRTLVCGLPRLPSAVCPRTLKKSTLKFKIRPSGLTLPSEIVSEDLKDLSVEEESALNVPQRSSLPCYNASSSCIEFSDSQSHSLKSKLHNVDLNVQAMESKDSGGLNVAGHELASKPSCASVNVEFSDLPSPTSKSEPVNVGLKLCSGESEDNGALNVPECNLGSKSSSASENMESSGLGTKQSLATSDIETSDVPNHTGESETDNVNMNLQGSASKDSGIPNSSEHDVDVLTKLEPDNVDMSLQVSGSIDCGASDVLESEVGAKPSHPASKSEPDNVEVRAQGRKSGSSDTPEVNLGAEKSSFSSDVGFCDLPITKPKLDDDAPAIESADVQQSVESNSHGQDSGIQWDNCSGGVEINDVPRSVQKASNDGLKDCVVEIKQPVSSNIPGQSSGVSWNTGSSLVGEVHLPEVAGEWNQCSQMETKPSVEDLDSDLVSSCLLKLTEAVSNYATPPHSCQFSHSSPSHLECSTSRWHAMEPIELSTLGDESVSDLLSEVEALESLKLLASPSSRMNPETDQIGSPKSDCFSILVGLSPRFDPGKHVHDTLNSTCEMQFHSAPTAEDESQREFQVHVHNNVRTSDAQSTPSPEIEAELDKAFASIQENELKPAVIPMHQGISSPLESSLSQLPVSTVTLDSSSVGLECNVKPSYALLHQGNNIISHTHHLAQLQPSCTGMDCPLSSRVEEELKPAFSGVPPHGLISQAHPSTASTAATGGLVSSFGLGPMRELKPAVIPMHQQISVSRSSPTVLSPASPRVCVSASHGEVGEVKPLISVHGMVLEAQSAAALPLAARSPRKKEEAELAFSMHEEALVSESHSTAPTASSPPPAMNVDAMRSPQGGERFVLASVSVHEDAVVSEAHQPTPPSLPAAPPPVHLDPSRSVGEEGTVMPPSVSMQRAGSVSKVHRPATPPTSTSPQSYTSAPEEGEVVPPSVSAQQSSLNTVEEGEVVPPPVSTCQPELISQSQLPIAETKSRDMTATLAPGRAGLLPTPQTTTQDVTAAVSPGRPRLEKLDAGRGTYREDSHTSWNGSAMQNTYIAGRDSQGINIGNTNVHRANHVANQGTIASHQQSRHRSAGRHSGPKDRNYQGIVDSGFGRGRPSWGRQPSFGSGGSSRQPPHRGPRVCKFYESGYCKRGASCSYLHPSKQ